MSQSSYNSPQKATRKAVPRLPTLLGVVAANVDEYETLLQDYPQLTDRLSGMISTITAYVVHEKVKAEGKGAIVVPAYMEDQMENVIPEENHFVLKNLSPYQYRFYEMVSIYPRFSNLWDWKKRELNVEAYNKALTVMSHGEVILAKFFVGLWLNRAQGLDILTVAELSTEDRQLITNWLNDPFWP